MNIFKETFKYYNKISCIDDMKDVINFSKDMPIDHDTILRKDSCELNNIEIGEDIRIYFNPISEWKTYQLREYPGFIFIKNIFPLHASVLWAITAMRDYSKPPYYINVNCDSNQGNSLWDHSLRTYNNLEYIKRHLRWIQLGYKFDYQSHTYSLEHHSAIPELLKELFLYISKVLGFKNFSPETSIMNFYPAVGGDIPKAKCVGLCGHQDIYEPNLDNPLFSISFGQPCIYLLGTDSKNDKPTAIYFGNGDAMIMSGESRRAFHAVPKVFCEKDLDYGEYSSSLFSHILSLEEWELGCEYLNSFRLNINTRQMF